MNLKYKPIIILTIILTLIFSMLYHFELPANAQTAGIGRFALIIGANNGGLKRVRLRYAATDAQSVSKVLTELGGISKENYVMLIEPDRSKILSSLGHLANIIKTKKSLFSRTEFILYYSGHSDEEGLLLNSELFSYSELRQSIKSLPADVQIAILDSCSSGALTRGKGGKHLQPFLFDVSSKVKGHAFLTSSSADEAAQESDKIGSSFFTHYLISGLRGAADMNMDGRITLNEAYQFAFSETLARTEKTRMGAQHPAYDMQLAGTGDVVMTDIRSTKAGLVLHEKLYGRLYIRDKHGKLIVELNKLPMRSVELGLDSGNYIVTVEKNGELFGTDITLSDGKKIELEDSQLKKIEGEITVARGNSNNLEIKEKLDINKNNPEVPGKKYVHVPFKISLVPGISTVGLSQDNIITNFSFNIIMGYSAKLDGFEIGFINMVKEEAKGFQISWGANIIGDVFGKHKTTDTTGNFEGFQIAGFANFVKNNSGKLQIAGTANFVMGNVKGVQIAGLGNFTKGDSKGVQIAGLTNLSLNNVHGVQLASILNYAGGNVNAPQISAVANVALKDVKGPQIAGVTNIVANGKSNGVQIAGVFNYAKQIKGIQIGTQNLAGEIDGLQIGVLNIANKVSGMQIGVINLSNENNGVPIGLLSISKNGQHQLSFWSDETMPLNIGLELGTKYVYNTFFVGLRLPEYFDSKDFTDEEKFFAGLGLGVHIPMGPLYMNVDVTSGTVFKSNMDKLPRHLLHRGRIIAGWQMAKYFSPFAGASFNLLQTKCRTQTSNTVNLCSNDEFNTKMSIGFLFGFSI